MMNDLRIDELLYQLLLLLELAPLMPALYVIPNDIIIAFINFYIIFRCNCTNCSAVMAAILYFSGEATLSISETAFPATGNIIGTEIVKITPIDATLWQSVQFYICWRPSWIMVTGLQNQLH